jgi:hypothetical protein
MTDFALCSDYHESRLLTRPTDNYRNYYLSTNHAHHINDWKNNFNTRRDYNTNGWRLHNNYRSAYRVFDIIRSRSNRVVIEQGWKLL